MKKVFGLLILTIVFLTGCFNPPFGSSPEALESNLEVSADRILFSREVDDVRYSDITGKVENYGKVVEYLYATDVEVPVEKNEIIERRTVRYKIIDLGKSVDGRNKREIRSHTGNAFYEDKVQGKWFEIASPATTTLEIFQLQARASLGKKIARWFIGQPVMAEDSSFSGAGDGHVRNSGTVFLTVRNAGTGEEARPTHAVATFNAYFFSPNFFLGRLFHPYDTSGIPFGSTIDGGEYSAFVASNTYASNNPDGHSMACVETSQPDHTTYTTAEFDSFGTTRCSDTDIAWSTMDANEKEYKFTLNQNALDNMVKTAGQVSPCGTDTSLTGWTCLGQRSDNDLSSTAPSGASWGQTYNSEQGGTALDPILVIQFTEPAPAASQVIIIN